MIMVRAFIAAVFAAVLAAGSSLAEPSAAPAPTKAVDPARLYSGVWRQIGRSPMALTKDCVSGSLQYAFTPPAKVQVRDTCRMGGPEGTARTIAGPATILDPGFNAKILVRYKVIGLVPIEAEYWVLDHDDPYTWFIQSTPGFKHLWIYSRKPELSAAERQALVDRARALGYDVTKLEFPVQFSSRGAPRPGGR
jgi:apolipoprotein D and lipocalin family protein